MKDSRDVSLESAKSRPHFKEVLVLKCTSDERVEKTLVINKTIHDLIV